MLNLIVLIPIAAAVLILLGAPGRRTALGAAAIQAVVALICLLTYDKAGEPLKALPLYQEAYEKSGAMFGWDSAETLKRTSNLAIAYSATGDPKKALPLFQHTLEKRQSVLGPDKPETLKSMNNLAFVYLELKEYEKSLEQFKALLAARRRIDEKDPQIAGLESQIEMIEKQARESTLIGNNGSHGPGQTQK